MNYLALAMHPSFYDYSLSQSSSGSSTMPMMTMNTCAIDKKRTGLQFTSNDSGISIDCSDNDSCVSEETTTDINHVFTITEDVHRASVIPDDEKKFFCENTMWAWHGEFARLILATALINDFDIRLLPDHARSAFSNLYFSMVQHENAKAQFQCDLCGYCWTSMRARCSFYVTAPNPIVLVFFKLYTQQCQYCYSIVSPLWYFDEICRVMKRLAEAIHRDFFPNSLELIQWDLEHDGTRYVRRFYQRKGQMHAQHNQSLCEACQFHLCYT